MGPKIAIVHDYLNQRGGAERVVGVLHEMFPDAPVYTLLLDRGKLWPSLEDANIIPSFLSRFKIVNRRFKLFFWLYPFVIRSFTLKGFDIVISSSSAYAKAVRLPKKCRPVHICYCHTPMRFAWEFDQYIRNETSSRVLRFVARCIVPFLKRWDKRMSGNVDVFIANSNAVSDRINRVYGRRSVTIFPPVETQAPLHRQPKGYFLVVSRLVSYKKIDLAIEACNALGENLVIIGDGPDTTRLKAMAGDNITFLGFQPSDIVQRYFSECEALIFPGEEDFGMTPVEAHLQGCPVVAYRAGGALDTIQEGINGLFFVEPTAESLAKALNAVSSRQWDSKTIIQTAQKFSRTQFQSELFRVVEHIGEYLV